MLTNIADWADTLTSIAVLGSLIFVVVELRRSNLQNSLQNNRETIAGMNALRSVTNDPFMADLILRARAGLDDLTDTEKLTFDRYLRRAVTHAYSFQMVLSVTRRDNPSVEYVMLNTLREELDNPGGREWLETIKHKRLIGPEILVFADRALSEGAA